ncbi:hypothetical protein O6H91_Y027500 [Diphasiastrum complanatum]|nr:hypothetical protein O6H91_Y027500 [Diphasiastrum complanatum]
MEDNGATNEMESLFEGMDLNLSSPFDIPDVGLTPADAGFSKENLAGSEAPSNSSSGSHSSHPGNSLTALDHFHPGAPPPLHISDNASTDSSSVRALGNPLDESLFSGLSFSAGSVPFSTQDTKETSETSASHNNPEFLGNLRIKQEHMTSELLKQENNLSEKVADAHDKLLPKLSESNVSARQSTVGSALPPAPILTKPLMRRKKRGLKIGYGRDDDDSEESSLNRTAQKVMDNDIRVSYVVSDSVSEQRREGCQVTDIERLKDIVVLPIVGQSSQLVDVLDENVTEVVPLYLPDSVEEESTLLQDSEQVLAGEIGETRSPEERDGMETKVELKEKANQLPNEEVQVSGEDQIDREREVKASMPGSVEATMNSEEQAIDDPKSESILPESASLELDPEKALVEVADAGNASARMDSLTFEDKRLAIKGSIAEKVMILNEKAASISRKKKDAIQKRRQASENVALASLKRKQLEIELEIACEKEEFEMADKLNEKIAEAEQVMEVEESSLREAEANFDLAMIKLQEIMDLQISIEEEGVWLLEELKQEAEAVAERVKKDSDELGCEENARLTAFEEEIKLKRQKIALELRVIDEATSDLDTVIAESTKAETAEKYSLIDKRALLKEELEELMAQVRAKEADIAEHDKRIAEMDDKITSVTLRFEKQRTDFDTEAKSLSSLLKELDEESGHIDMEKLRLEDTLQKADEERINLEKVAVAAMDEWAAVQEALDMKKTAALAALQAKEKKAELVGRETQASKEAQALRQEAANARSYLQQELGSTRAKLQQEISTIQQRISYAEKRAPELEAEKRIAATARNFKEAARLAAEAKTLVAEKDALNLELDCLTSDLQKLDQEVESKVLLLADTEGVITAKEKVAAKARCERLRMIAKAAREERDVAIGLEDFEEAESLHAEAEAADSEANELQEAHQLQGKQ